MLAWARRGIGKLETKLNLCVIKGAVAEQLQQASTLDRLVNEMGGLGLKTGTIEAVRQKIDEKTQAAKGLQGSSDQFDSILLGLSKKEGEYAKIRVLAGQAAQLGLPTESTDDIEQRLRTVGQELEVDRVRFAQEVEYIAGRASRA
jgi:hypothetical protein